MVLLLFCSYRWQTENKPIEIEIRTGDDFSASAQQSLKEAIMEVVLMKHSFEVWDELWCLILSALRAKNTDNINANADTENTLDIIATFSESGIE